MLRLSGQLQATRRLCHLYQAVCPDEAQCIIYNEHQLALLRKTGDKSQEGEVLQAISRLYLSQGTERWAETGLSVTESLSPALTDASFLLNILWLSLKKCSG